MSKQYGKDGFMPTVTGSEQRGDALILETLDPRPETDLVSIDGEPLGRVAETLTEEQQEKLALRE